MNNAFRISQVTLRRRQWSLATVPLVVLAICAYRFHSEAEDLLTSALVLATAVTIAIFVARSQYKQFATFASHHPAELKAEALLLRTGDIETRIPYHSITQVIAMGSLRSPRVVILKLADGRKETLYGYAELHQLLEGRVLPRFHGRFD